MEHLEGPPSRHLSNHLETCNACRGLVDSARAAHAALTNLSPGSRRLCPPPEELAEVPAGVAKVSVRLHVALCADCRDDLADLAVLSGDPPGEVVARWLADGFAIVSQTLFRLAPQEVPLAAARGAQRGGSAWRLTQEHDDFALALSLAPGDGRSFALSVAVEPAAAGARVDLEADSRLLESRAMDASGLLSFLGLAPGRYRVTLRRPQGPPVATDVDVG